MSLTNYDNTPFNLKELGGTYMTGLARELQQLQDDPLNEFLPQLTVPDRFIRIERIDDDLRLTGAVNPGMPNNLNSWDKGTTMDVRPAYFRRGDTIDMDTINYLRQPGTEQKRWGMGIVQRQMKKLVDQCNMMWTVLRAQLFSGAINYTDVQSGVSVQANSGIPASNFFVIGSAGGAHADFNSFVKWTDLANSNPIDDLLTLKHRTWRANIAAPDTILMNGTTMELLMKNEKIRGYQRNDSGLNQSMGFVTFANGQISTINGMRVIVVNTLYDEDYLDGNGVLKQRRKYILPVNKIVVFASKNPRMPGEALGHTFITQGESPSGTPGIWVETWDHKTNGGPTTAPGVSMQVGMAGLPFFIHPAWVNIVQIAEVADVTSATGSLYVV